MGLITWIKAVWNKLFRKEIEERFHADIQLSSVMESEILKYYNITSGKPPWLNPENDIESINFAGYINDVTAGLVTLDLGIDISGSARAEYLQKQADYVLAVITDKVSEGLGNCGIMLKPSPYKGREPGYRAVQKRRTGNRRIHRHETGNAAV